MFLINNNINLQKIKVICVLGKSGVGKSTWINRQEGHIVKSYTTRPIRHNDPKDKHTHVFVDKEFYQNSNKLLSYYNAKKDYHNWVDINSFSKDAINLYAVDIDSFNEMCECNLFDVSGVYIYADEQLRATIFNKERKEQMPLDEHLSIERIKDMSKVTILYNDFMNFRGVQK